MAATFDSLLMTPADQFLAEMLGSQSITAKAKRRRTDGRDSPTLEVSRLGDEEGTENAELVGNVGSSRRNVDDLLPIGVSIKRCLALV